MTGRISLLTLNMWNLNEPFGQRQESLDSYIRKTAPDIISFQEVPVRGGRPIFPAAMKDLGYECCYVPSGVWEGREEGLAVCSRLPFTIVAAVVLPTCVNDTGRSAVIARFTDVGKVSPPLLVVNTHLSYRPEHKPVRLQQVAEIRRVLDELRGRLGLASLVVAGDLNSTPEEGTVGALASGEPLLRDLQADFGLGSKYTFDGANPYVSPDLWPNRRIDYLLASLDLEVDGFEVVLNSAEKNQLASDHYGLVADFNLP